MVSLNTILAIGGVGAAYLIFKSLGGASGIGSSIGRGASQFSESIVSGLTGNIIPNFDNPLNTSTPEGFRLDPNRSKQTYDDYINYKDDGSPPTSPSQMKTVTHHLFLIHQQTRHQQQLQCFNTTAQTFLSKHQSKKGFLTKEQRQEMKKIILDHTELVDNG